MKDKSDFVIKALESAIAEHRLLDENSTIGKAKAIAQVENEISAIEKDHEYVDAAIGLRVVSIPDSNLIKWLGPLKDTELGQTRDPTSKQHAETGFYTEDPFKGGVWFTPEAYDRYSTMGRDYYERLVSEYKKRIQQLVVKRDRLKSEVLR